MQTNIKNLHENITKLKNQTDDGQITENLKAPSN